MSRLWSRYGLRAAAVGLLAIAVAGGQYLGMDRESQQRAFEADLAAQAEVTDLTTIKQYAVAQLVGTVHQRAAERAASTRASAAARQAADRAREVDKKAASRKAAQRTESRPRPTVPFPGPVPASCGVYTGNRKIGCALLLKKGFELKQMPCLDKLWKKESGWNHRARNRSSGAYGIPQSLPPTKMASVAPDWENNPATQIIWGLGYIKGRYKTPCGAWAHSVDTGWY